MEVMINLTIEKPIPNNKSILPLAHEYVILEKSLIPMWLVIFFFGMTANIMNILVFIRSGLTDSVTIVLLCLSVSDFCFLTLMTPWLATVFIINFVPNWNWNFDLSITAFLFYWPAFTFYDFSAYVSVFLGVTRCACVALPLHFKSVFTKSRTEIVIFALFISAILLRIPMLIGYSIGTKPSPLTNQTYVFLKRHVGRTNVLVNDTLNRTSLPWVAFIIMVACVIILSVKLSETSKVRQSSRSVIGSASGGTKDKPDAQGQQDTSNSKISAKETQVVQSVVLVCVIFILSQLPFLLYSTARLINPEFDSGKKFHAIYSMCTKLSLTCSFLNSSINIFIYYNYNSKYRSALKSVFLKKFTTS